MADVFGPAMTSMLALATAELTTPVGRTAVYPGAEVAWDDCCDGQLWMRIADLAPAGNQPVQPCGVLLWAATLGLGILRCVSTLDDQGNAPTPAELNADSVQMGVDRAELLATIQCGFVALAEKITIVRWLPIGPGGGCAGGEWTFRALFTASCDCT